MSKIFWIQSTASAAFSPRVFHSAHVVNNKLQIVGGSDSPPTVQAGKEQSCSSDGVTWTTPATATGLASDISGHFYANFGGKIYVMGGVSTLSVFQSKIYSAITDCSTWTAVTDMPATRSFGDAATFGDKVYITGGRNGLVGLSGSYLSAVLTFDGTTVASVGTIPSDRLGHKTIAYNGKLYLMGGYYGPTDNYLNDIWSTTDGVTWTQETSSAAWAARTDFGLTVLNGVMWVFGGTLSSSPTFAQDMWYSTDGVNFTESTSTLGPGIRYLFPKDIVFNDKMWMIAGGDVSGRLNDVWYGYRFQIDSLSLTSGSFGTVLPINGVGFSEDFSATGDDPQVFFGSTEATLLSFTDTQALVYVPQITPGDYDVTVVNPDGNTSNAISFEVLTSFTDPQIMLRWSNDGGHTWSNELWRAIGKLGEYETEVKFFRLGYAYDRVYEFRITDPVKVTIIAGNIDVEVSE